jgi:hypothetical protein
MCVSVGLPEYSACIGLQDALKFVHLIRYFVASGVSSRNCSALGGLEAKCTDVG